MLKLYAITKENGNIYFEEVRHKRPRNYLQGCTFDTILKYAKKELINQDINLDTIKGFEIRDDSWHTTTTINKL